MLWELYIEELVAYLPDICLVDQEIWWMISPLICFETLEWHHLERVLRSFDLHQGIPPSWSYIWLIDKDATSKIGRHIMHNMSPDELRVQRGSSHHFLRLVLWTSMIHI